MTTYSECSPLKLASALGYRIDLRGDGVGNRSAHIVGGRVARLASHARACDVLSRLARLRGISASTVLSSPEQRALINGQEQTA